LHRKAYDPQALPITTLNFTKDHKNIRFAVDSTRYNYNLPTEKLTVQSRPWRANRDSIPTDEERAAGGAGGGGRGGGGGGGGAFGGGGGAPDFRNFSPDSTAFVFAREHNLYFVEVAKGDTVQLTRDGERNYSFGFRDTAQTQQQDTTDEQQGGQQQNQGGANNRDPRVRANVTWAKDSKAFFTQRTDQRKVKELYLVNVLAEPRPTLVSYRYAMPGEEDVGTQEMWVYVRGEAAAKKAPFDKWKDQRLQSPHWPVDNSTRMRFTRRDRLQRNAELVEYDPVANTTKVLVTESVEGSFLELAAPRYIKTGGDFIWQSERSGWQHLYLYSHDGQLKRPLSSGAWRVMSIAEVDSVKGVVYMNGVGRNPEENPYNTHFYKINLDGTGFAEITPGPYNHAMTLSPTKRYLIDSYSRVDTVPQVVMRDATTGRVVQNLETADLSRMYEMGWQMPTTFQTKAADGVTDIYGNMWKPFDFDSTKKYPIIANVYPGPQTESVTGGFTSGGVPQQLAQLGFIVIQIGNRGGNPARSNAYHSYGYYNLRDYALADKKAGIEQLAARYKWIDLDRVGIFGHSGGGFLTGAALLLPPYNEFFKVGVSSAGNHDNNIYNANWSEQHHGLREVLADSASRAGAGAAGAAGRGGAAGQGGRGNIGGGGRGGAGQVGQQQQTQQGRGQVLQGRSQQFQIRVPTNHELAANLKGKLLLVHGDMDNNVHPGGTIRLVNALIQQNKRFDMMILPGRAHGFAEYQPYFTQMLMEYFATHLLGDYYQSSAEMSTKK
jgi:dipeptidyl aminopeptidase/acylaminoacyl peptidase